MFIVLLKFSANREKAAQFMDGHKAWIKNGFDDGVFLLAGSLAPNAGGAVVAHNISRLELEARVNADPFVVQDVVVGEILDISPSRLAPQLAFLNP